MSNNGFNNDFNNDFMNYQICNSDIHSPTGKYKKQGSGDLLTQSADPVGVFYFQADHVPAAVITVRVFLKCCQCFFSVNLHCSLPHIFYIIFYDS